MTMMTTLVRSSKNFKDALQCQKRCQNTV